MENTKNLHIVVLQMPTIDLEEVMRIRGVLRALAGKEPVAISDKTIEDTELLLRMCIARVWPISAEQGEKLLKNIHWIG